MSFGRRVRTSSGESLASSHLDPPRLSEEIDRPVDTKRSSKDRLHCNVMNHRRYVTWNNESFNWEQIVITLLNPKASRNKPEQ